jgi:UDP-glucuronate 4-epimerase
MDRVLVTGANGFIGRAVASALARGGRRVVGTDLTIGGEAEFSVIAADLCDRIALETLMKDDGVAAILHCGALSGPMLARNNPELICRTNIVGTVNVLECARTLGVRRVVFCSSCGVYGNTGPAPVDEEAPFAATDLYGASKAAGDMLVRAYAAKHGVDGICLRAPWVYGPRRTTDCVIRTMLSDALARRTTKFPFGTGFHRQFVFLDDVVEALLAALDIQKAPQRAYNIAGGARVSFDELAKLVRETIPNADIQLGPGPDPEDYDQELFDISAAARDLGWRPRCDLRHGITAYASWLEAAR